MGRSYTAAQLGQLTGVSERTVRYYVRERLIDPPTGRGRGAHFDDHHVAQLNRVRVLQDAGLDHAAIRQYGAEIATVLASRGVALKDLEHSWASYSRDAAQTYRRLSARAFVPRTSLVTRVNMAPGIDLYVEAGRRLPQPSKLNEMAGMVRAAFGVTDAEDGDD
jgi:DNA-binding transcriptional MerR regulator